MIAGKELLSCRQTLWLLVFTGCIINYMLKFSLNLAIVAMVVPRAKSPTTSQCTSGNSSSLTPLTVTVENPLLSQNISYTDRFNWTEYEQGMVLGAFFWTYWATHVLGGLLAQHYGTKLIFGGANFIACIIVVLIPVTIKYHLYAFLALRVLQGAVMGVVLPSMNVMTAKWIPPTERSKFVSAYMGGTVGTSLTYLICAIIIHYFNWETAFYTMSVAGTIWYCFWLYCAYDSPQQHPRISKAELKYILENTPPIVKNSKEQPIPWRHILTSGPFWIAVFSHWGATWGFYTLLTQSPSYFSFIHGWDINMTGLISGAPHIPLMIFSYTFAIFCDWLLKNNKMTRTGVRKLAMFIATILQACFIVGLSLSGCHSNFAVFFMLCGTITNGAISSATLANFVDLSPNYSSILFGICGLIANGAGALSPTIVGILTNGNQTIESWRIVFLITAANLTCSGILYLIWGTGEEQPWNNLYANDDEQGEELQKLKQEPTETTEKCDTVDEKKLKKEKEANGLK